jgi:hypothetical protein
MMLADSCEFRSQVQHSAAVSGPDVTRPRSGLNRLSASLPKPESRKDSRRHGKSRAQLKIVKMR